LAWGRNPSALVQELGHSDEVALERVGIDQQRRRRQRLDRLRLVQHDRLPRPRQYPIERALERAGRRCRHSPPRSL
jgi:hypothetical protein